MVVGVDAIVTDSLFVWSDCAVENSVCIGSIVWSAVVDVSDRWFGVLSDVASSDVFRLVSGMTCCYFESLSTCDGVTTFDSAVS